jgi:secreted trypsin-like serine protease
LSIKTFVKVKIKITFFVFFFLPRLFNLNDLSQVGILAYVTGWGLTQDGQVPEKLSQVTVTVIDQKACNKAYNDTVVGKIIPGELCTNAIEKGPCRGDSGSPLVINGRQAGIVSLGIDCLYPEYPAIYADVAYFSNWITAQIKNKKKKKKSKNAQSVIR